MKNIVLGYDDTEASQRALERATQLAKAFESQLVVTSVAPSLGGTGRLGPVDPTEPPAEHVRELDDARTYLESQGIQADYQPAIGHLAETIVELAETRGADLIIVGTHEPNVLERLLGRSVSEAVEHRAHCDVLIVHPTGARK